MDLLSNLPDSILCHILSFLPTRIAVATSILSRRWRHLWKDLQVLDLDDDPVIAPIFVPAYSDDESESPEESENCFVAFVNNVISQVHHIQRFRLSCVTYDFDALRSWINAITGPLLQEMYICIWNHYDYQSLPCEIFTCTSLVSLTLKRDILVDNLPSVHLPSLKYLKLDVAIVILDRLLCGCPALETLEVYSNFGWCNKEDEHQHQALHMPHSLKRLTFREHGYHQAVQLLEIHTPSLEYINITLTASYLGDLVSHFPNMVEARLGLGIFVEDVHLRWVPQFLKALCKTRSLVLKHQTTECLLRASAQGIPEFHSLLRLEVEFQYFSSRFLLDWLHNCHRLQVLIIHNYGMKFLDPIEWTQPIPNCVISHLNTIEFNGYRDSASERMFAAYILQRGLVLKMMIIHTRDLSNQEEKDHILKELSIVPRGSSICQLILD